MKALIIGGGGFVGPYLARHLYNDLNYDVTVTKMENETVDIEDAKVRNLNILKPEEIKDLLIDEKPDYIFHLAAQSSVAVAWKKPALTVDINIKGCLNLLDVVRAEGLKPRILLIGSGEEYGHIKDSECPIVEDNTLRPGNIYAITKAAQNMLGKVYADAYDMDIVMVRAFNHIGPNQLPTFVVADFCKQVAEIEKGLREAVIYVGNLTAKRDFTDVRDVVRAYAALVKEGKKGESYNVGTGSAIAIQEILNRILSFSESKIEVKVDENKLRPVDVPIIEPNTMKIYEQTGWKPEISINTTIKETLDYWRNKVS